MKKKLILAISLVALFVCLFAISVSAETPNMYIEFGARFPSSDNYITVYTENAESTGNPRIDFASKKFYSDVDFTQEVDMSTATGIDFSVTKTYVSGVEGNAVTRMVKPSSPFTNCTEVKWFLAGMPSVSYNGSFFKGWTGLKSFDFGNATQIADNTFEGCGLESVTIPASITSIGGSAFKDCLSLKSVKIEGSITKFNNGQTFQGCTALESVDLGTSTYIGSNMFYGCTKLASITLPSTIKEIQSGAFYGCTALASVNIPSGVTGIYQNAFRDCISLTSVEIPATVTTMKENIFYNCTGITSAKLNEGVPYVGQSMFNGCTSLASLTLPTTITEIKSNAFTSCSALTSVTIPENVTSIGSQAFLKAGITSFHVPAKVKTLGYQVAESTPITSLTFAENSQLTFIDHRAFMDCDSLVGPIILPDGLEEIDYGLFSGCALLKAVKMPDTVTTITGNASLFSSCPKLEYVQLSKNLTGTIFSSMFEGCSSLKAISFPDGVTKIDYKALRNCTSLEAVYLPSGLIELGSVNASANDWGVFYQSPKVYLVNEPFDVFDGDTLLGDSFVMPEKPEVYYMPNGMTALGNSAFQNCTNLNEYIVFPTGVTSVGESSQGAFFKASSSTNPVTFVFLGDMTSIRIRQNDNASSNMSFVFANPNDTCITSMSFIIGSANNAYMTNTYAYFCKSNTVYDLSTFKATNATVHTVTEEDYTKTVNTAETQPHFHSPRLNKTSDATCTLPAGSFTYCFCGTLMTSDVVEGSEPLGHDSEGADISKYYPTIEVNGDVVTNYFANIVHSFVCQREECQQTIVEAQEGTALFTKKGFTAPENSEQPAICHAITVNVDAILEYNKILGAGNEIKYGVVVGKATASGKPVNAQGTSSGDAIVVGFEGTDYSFIQAKITNVPAETGLYCSAYVVDADVVTYLYEGSVTSTAQVISISAENATLPEATVSSNDEE